MRLLGVSASGLTSRAVEQLTLGIDENGTERGTTPAGPSTRSGDRFGPEAIAPASLTGPEASA